MKRILKPSCFKIPQLTIPAKRQAGYMLKVLWDCVFIRFQKTVYIYIYILVPVILYFAVGGVSEKGEGKRLSSFKH